MSEAATKRPRSLRRWQVLAALLLLVARCPQAVGEGDKESAPYQVQSGVFPPEGSSRAMRGELIQVDHVNRTGQLRPDRGDDQRTDDYDRSMRFTMLPYGAIRYHGAPAELRDIPIGTHLHGQFHFDPTTGKDGKGAFTQALSLEDDFSFHQRQNRAWRVDAVQLDKGAVVCTAVSLLDNKPDAKSTLFRVNTATRVWKGRGFGELTDLVAGQTVLLDITVATLKGPGRCTDIWLDEESRRLATTHQTEVHRAYQMAHGLAGWIDAVNNEEPCVTVTLFGGFDRSLNQFKPKDRIAVLVAEESLRCYDPVNDRMYCEILEVRSVPVVPGGSGLQLVIKPENLLEGFRPRRIVRLLASNWPLDDLPWEEMLWPADNRLK